MSALSRWPVKLALLFVALVALVAVFADLLACEAPLIADVNGHWMVLPGLTHPHRSDQAELARRARGGGFVLFAPVRFGPRTTAVEGPLVPSSRAHPLGTDRSGHDVLAELVFGTRTVVFTTLLVLLLALSVGVTLGAFAGAGPPLPDAILARAVELCGAVPTLILLALLRAGTHVPGTIAFVLLLAVFRSLEIARLVRGEVLRVGGTDFVLAARALGQSTRGIIRNHLLPHVLAPVLVSAAFTGSSVVALEAAFGFVGLGLSGDAPSWGGLLAQVGSGVSPAGMGMAAALATLTTGCLYVVADALDDRAAARRTGPSRV
jgi:ABC-type dipeptide/oligopeptide/nickel transport system permease subunit